MDLLCGQCGRTLKTDDAGAGKTIQCPHCGHGIEVPALDAAGEGQDALIAPLQREDDLADEFLTKARLALKRKMLVQCGSCSERLTVEHRLAGKVTRCPSCGGPIRIPSQTSDEDAFGPGDLIAEAKPAPDELDIIQSQLATRPPPAAGKPHRPPPPQFQVPSAEPLPPDTAVPAELAEAVAGQPPPIAMAGKVRPPTQMVLLVIATVLGALAAGFLILRPTEPPPRSGVARQEAPVQQPEPATEPAPIPAPPATSTAPVRPPQPAQPLLEVASASLRIFGGDGSAPAPFRQAFLDATVKVQTGDQPLTLDTRSDGIVLESPQGKHKPLGFGGSGTPLLAPARPGAINLPPRTARECALVFLVPENFTGGTLTVAGLGQADLSVPKAPPAAPTELPGTYSEVSRYLRLSFADPVMEQLRASAGQQLVIQAKDDAFLINVSPVGLRGQAKPNGDGGIDATLGNGAASLSCRLRQSPDGKRLILYLAEAPFHQIVYEKQ